MRTTSRKERSGSRPQEVGADTSATEQFYDSLAGVYHLLFEDWDRAIARQAGVPDALIRSKCGQSCLVIHDCTCGIGTQAIGLASLGYRVSGSASARWPYNALRKRLPSEDLIHSFASRI